MNRERKERGALTDCQLEGNGEVLLQACFEAQGRYGFATRVRLPG